MEHYALRIPAGVLAAPAGTRLIRVVPGDPRKGEPVSCESLDVIAYQTTHVYHYMSDVVRSVDATPELMTRNGWHFKHADTRFAPVALTGDGRLVVLEPEDPDWSLLPPHAPASLVEERSRELVRRRLEVLEQEAAVEEREQGTVEGD